jgi:hypothetical protein
MRVADEMALVMLAQDAEDEPTERDWRRTIMDRLTPDQAVATLDERTTVTCTVPPRLAYLAGVVASDRSLPRGIYIARLLARDVEASLGMEPGTFDIPVRKPGKPYRKPKP